jgi:arylsulfatase A-like enzyme
MKALTLLTALLLAPLAALHAAEAPKPKPNIVFILVDDMPYAGPSVTGNKLQQTPHMDRIAKEGILFSRAYTEPLCGPSRATLMTGQFAGRHGRTDNVPGVHPYALMQEPLLPVPSDTRATAGAIEAAASARLPDPVQPGGYSLVQALKAGGYRTGITGKWHLPLQHLTPKLAPRYGFDFCTDKPDRSQPYRDTKHFTDDAIQFIRDNSAQSFFLYLPYVAVHGGHVVPPEDQARWKERLKGKNVGIDPDMLATLEFVDLSVGRILDALDELKLAENTMVILASDNGGVGKDFYSVDNAPFRLGKGTLYEGGVRVPLFIRWPGQIQPGSRCDVPVHFVDLFPTLCDAAGVKTDPAHKLDGTNLRPLFTGRTLLERTLFVTYPHYIAEFGTTPVRAAIQSRYKLVWNPYDHIEIAGDRVTSSTIRYVPQPRVELFDMESDPGEHENLAARYPELVTELRQRMEVWMKETGAKDVTPNPAYDASRPLFNARDEAIKKEQEQKKAKK